MSAWLRQHSRILITGIGKTGSTALFYAILKSLPEETIATFEPEKKNRNPRPEGAKPPTLVKSFIPHSEEFSCFERKVLIIRDPRDNLISLLLYRPYNILVKGSSEKTEKALAEVDAYIEMIRRKEASPGSVSVRELHDHLKVSLEKRMAMISDYYTRHPDAFLFRYEDFIDKRLAALEDYLQLRIDGEVEIPAMLQRVARSKSYGSWRSWFTPSDVEFFRPLMSEFLDRFGYADDWKLDSKPELEPEFGSLYVEKLCREASELRIERKSRARLP